MTSFDEQLRKIAQHGEISALRELLTQVDSVDWITHQKSGDQVAHLLARHGKVDMMELLFDRWGLPIECANLDGKTPLHEAALHSHVNVIKFLLKHGAYVDPLKRAGWTPLMMACTKPDLEVVKILVENGANINLQNKVILDKYLYFVEDRSISAHC